LNFGLPENGGTCPGATLGRGGCLDVRDGKQRPTCYMAKVTQVYKKVGDILEHNTALFRGKSELEMTEILRKSMLVFCAFNLKENWRFRLHYSGDFFSTEYAKAWATVIKENPEVRFWVYTRSFDLVPILVECPNLTLMLSADSVNKDRAVELYNKYKDKPNVGLAWLGLDSPAGEKWVTCPETSGRLKNTDERGACATCRLCVDNYKSKVRNIKFKLH
jgi:hypothetical protein